MALEHRYNQNLKKNLKSEAAKRVLEMLGIEPKAFPMR
jgi:hypothetical protein